MWALCVYSGNEQTYAIWSLAVVLCVCLCTVANSRCDFGKCDGSVVSQSRGEGLLFHEVGEHARVGGKTGEGNAIVRVDFDDFALV